MQQKSNTFTEQAAPTFLLKSIHSKTIFSLMFLLVAGLVASQSVQAQTGCLNFSTAVAYSSGDADPNSVAAGDFNGDGKADLAVTHELASDIGILFNNGNGTFAAAVVYPSGGNLTNSIAVGDFNGDGKVDLAVANRGFSDIGVLLNNGNGTFAPAVVYSSGGGGQTSSVVIGDFSGDGSVDLAVTNYATSSISVLLNNGNGTFAPAVVYPSGGTQPRTVAVGDFNADGKFDLVVANTQTHNIGVLLNNGNGTFAPAVLYPMGANYPSFLKVGDFNSDNTTDLAVTNEAGIGVLMGNGDGTFTSAVNYAALYGTLATGDVNGDAIPDLLIPRLNSSFVQVLVNNGTGTFAPAVSFHSGGGGSHSAVIKDFDGDGKNDIVVSNFNSASVGYLLNTSTCCTAPNFTINAPVDPVPITNAVSIAINHTNNNLAEVLVNWGDGTGVKSVSFLPNAFTVSNTYSQAGVYTIEITLKNSCELTTTKEYKYVVVYDPSAGFITGVGFINSAPGAYTLNPALTGKASFGFVSKYLKGQTQPTGNTQFEFNAAELNFKSTIYDWLVISGAKGQFKGSGIINGSGNYGFLVSAVDGKLLQNAFADKFRIKIWDKTTNSIVYDNQPGDAEDASATTSIAGGSIVIHSSNTKATTSASSARQSSLVEENTYSGKLKVIVMPNPSSNHFDLVLQGQEGKLLNVRVLDVLGRVIEKRNNISANGTVRIGNQYRAGIYLVEVIQGSEKRVFRLIKNGK